MLKKNSQVIFLIFIYRLLLDFVYTNIISPNYGYSNFINNATAESTFISIIQLIIFVPFFIKYFSEDGFVYYTIILLGLMYFIPGTSLMRFIPMKLNMVFVWNIFWIILMFFGSKNYKIQFSKILLNNSKMYGYIIILIFCLAVLYVSYKYTDFRFLITFTDEYTLRTEQRGYTLGLFLQYIYSMSSTVISLAICIFSSRKRYLLVIILFSIQIFNFSIGGHKTYLLLSVVAIVVGCVYHKFYSKVKDLIIIYGFIGILLMECIENLIFQTFNLTANISRRVFFVPQLLNYYYYDFFSNNEYDYFRQGPLRFFGISSEYDKDIALIIGETYMDEPSNACNGLFSEAYANMGILGVIILPIFLLLILFIIENIVNGIERNVVIFVAFTCAYIFGSGNISTGLLSNGIIVSILVCELLKSKRSTVYG